MKKFSFLTIFPYRRETTGLLSRLEFYPLTLISMAVIGFILLAYKENPWPKEGLIAYAVLAVLCTIAAIITHYSILARIAANQSTPSPFITSLTFIAIFLLITLFAWSMILPSIALLIVVWIDMSDAKESRRKKLDSASTVKTTSDEKDHY